MGMKFKSYLLLGVLVMLCVVLSACSGSTNTALDDPTEISSEVSPEAPTEIPTKAPTREPTRAPTETPPEVPTEAPAEYGQIKIWNWNDPEFYLTYDKAKWEATEYDSLVSKLYSGCMIGANGFRNYGPDGPPPMTYESDTHFLADTEFSLELEIPKATGVADMIHVSWDNYAYQLALFPSTEHYDECVAEFWEVMELSIANDFGL
jgi:hypothetical protein